MIVVAVLFIYLFVEGGGRRNDEALYSEKCSFVGLLRDCVLGL